MEAVIGTEGAGWQEAQQEVAFPDLKVGGNGRLLAC